MRLDDYENDDGHRVWLSSEEIDELTATVDDPTKRVAYLLGGRAGLRVSEITSVTFQDFADAPDGFVRVWAEHTKADSYREPPVPDSVQTVVETLQYGRNPDDPVVDVSRSTVWRWLRRSAEQLEEETGDRGWSFLDVHDLRRSWGAIMLWDAGVLPAVVMSWGGWEDWPTFRDTYMGEMSPRAAARERAKAFGGGASDAGELPFDPAERPSYLEQPDVRG
jgi:integrase